MEGFRLHVTTLCLISISFAAIYGGTTPSPRFPMTGLTIEGGQFWNSEDTHVIIRGTNRRDANYCALPGSPGIFEGPVDSTSITAMLHWNINTVRLPLNEFCWFDYNNVGFGGAQYQEAIQNYVALLEEAEMAAILTLAVAGPSYSTWPPTQVAPMPDFDHAITFWDEVSYMFQNYTNVIFDIYDQPSPYEGVFNTSDAWSCWLEGGTACPYEGYEPVGMQTLLSTIRANTMERIVLLTGIEYGNGMSEWSNYMPVDRSHQTAAIFHASNPNSYMDGYDCITIQCWQRDILPIGLPVVWVLFDFSLSSSECENEVTGTCENLYQGQKYNNMVIGWWDAATTCVYGSIITDWGGTPSAGYGDAYHSIIGLELEDTPE